jgi:membrane associated rhomboid family serine protease
MFMHADLAHIGGNMLYLWIFGDNVEDSMGSSRYLLFYLVGGMVASLTHIITNPGSQIPTVGASGAIAAVLGAYLVLYPQSKVLTIIPLGFFLRMTLVPASIVLGLWFVLQFFSGVLSLGGSDVGGVAFWAHIGGFGTGVVMAKLFARQRRQDYAVHW